MPNVHYVTIDMTKMGITNKDEVSSVITTNLSCSVNVVTDLSYSPKKVLLALDNPSGSITGTVCRKQRAKL